MSSQDEDLVRQTREIARSLEARGQIDAAVSALRRVGQVESAAQVLIRSRRFTEAGRLLVDSLPHRPRQYHRLDEAERKLALKAAICMSQGGELDEAIELFEALGEKQRAIEVLERAGDAVGAAKLRDARAKKRAKQAPDARRPAGHGGGRTADLRGARALEESGKLEFALDSYLQLAEFAHAGRVLCKLERWDEAADLFVQAERFYESGRCLTKAGEPARALGQLLRVARDDEHYRDACLHAISIATKLQSADISLDQFVTPFVRSGPQDDTETQAIYALARLYEKEQMPEGAVELYRQLADRSPGFRDVDQRLEAIQSSWAGSRQQQRRILGEDSAFRRGAEPAPGPRAEHDAQVPSLPPLPDLPPAPGQPAAARDQSHQPDAAMASARTEISPRQPEQSAPRAAPAARTAMQWPEATSPPPAAKPPEPRQDTPARPGGSYTIVSDAARERAKAKRAAATALGPDPQLEAGAQPAAAPPEQTGSTIAGMPPARASASPSAVEQAAPDPSVEEPASVLDQFEAGNVIADRYRILRPIGAGGMAAVFAAADLELDVEIAIKLFNPTVEDASLVSRFKQELLLTRQLSHRNVVRLYDIGTHQGCKFITMELLSGSELSGVIHQQGALPLEQGLHYLVQACAGLQAAHDVGIVHRDVKPENFFVTADDVLKVMDFGIAKRCAAKGLTLAGFIAGTPSYMAPEQINDFAAVNHLADVYALGVVAFEIFTGVVPFDHDEVMGILVQHLKDPPPPLRSLNPELPEALERIVLQVLEKDQTKRIQSCRELGEQLSALRGR